MSPYLLGIALLVGLGGLALGRRQLRNLALGPVWIAQLLTATKSFEDNPIIGSRRLNRWGLRAARVKHAYRLAAARRRKLVDRISADDRAAFERDGFVVREGFLPADAFAALVAQVAAHRGHTREKLEGDTVMRKLTLDAEALSAMPALRELIESEAWRGLLAYVGASAAAPVVYVQSLFRLARPGAIDPQSLLHADTFHPTVKAWLYLTDVAADGGPLVYVPGSHRLTPARLAWERRMSVAARDSSNEEDRQGSFRITPADLAELGLPEPRRLAVPANTLVVADTFGFHARGPSVGVSQRIEVWGIGPRTPFAPRLGIDRLAPIGQTKSKDEWRAFDGISAFDPPQTPTD